MTVYYKMRQILLQNATAILSKNATGVYYKMCQVFIENATILLQNGTVIKNATFITNCNSIPCKSKAILCMLDPTSVSDKGHFERLLFCVSK